MSPGFIGSNKDFPLVHDLLIFLLKENKAEYVDFYSYGLSVDLIQKAGFINRKKIKSLIIPGYFEPYEKKNVDIRFGYKISQSQRKIPVRLFKGDGDVDRPNAIKIK